ncbi:MAG: hypothetical protein AB7V32_08605 [Candidatus Berkiella sp.]
MRTLSQCEAKAVSGALSSEQYFSLGTQAAQAAANFGLHYGLKAIGVPVDTSVVVKFVVLPVSNLAMYAAGAEFCNLFGSTKK